MNQIQKITTALSLSAILVLSGFISVFIPSEAHATAKVGEYEWNQATSNTKGGIKGDMISWQAVASSDDGTKLLAAPYYGPIYTSVDSGLTWSEHLRDPQRNWQAVASNSDGTTLIAATNGSSIYTSSDSGATWVERTSAGSRNWSSVASSADGTKLVATVLASGYVYTSSDSGATWVERTSAGLLDWRSITSSADGTKLAAVTFTGLIYTSSDSGATWIARTSSGYRNWSVIVSSADGSKLFAATYLGYLYSSTDFGATWSEHINMGVHTWLSLNSNSDGSKLSALYSDWDGVKVSSSIYTSIDSGATWTPRIMGDVPASKSLASSNDGTKLIAAKEANGSVYISQDSGVTWVERTVSGARDWRALASNTDGTKLVAAISSFNSQAEIYTSTDSGTTWTKRFSGPYNVTSLSSSADGIKLVAVVDGGFIYASSDSGLTWTERTSAGSREWKAVTSSADGTKITAVSSGSYPNYYGFIYTSSDSGLTWTQRTSAGSFGWNSVSSSADGTTLLASGSDLGVYISKDGGVTWNSITALPVGDWFSIGMSADGLTMLAADNSGWDTNYGDGGNVFISKDGGTSWSMLNSLTPRYWKDYGGQGIDISDDGKKIALVDTYGSFWNDWYGGYVYTSIDGGATWNEQTSIGIGYWLGVSMSADGTKLTALGDRPNGFIYTATLKQPLLQSNIANNDNEEQTTPLPINSTPSNPEPITNTQPTFSGVTFPNGIVTVTVHSDPIVCTTVADAQGNWSCTLPSTIPPGTHTINVELTNPSTNQVTILGPYYVAVLGATTVTNNTPLAPNTGIAPKENVSAVFLVGGFVVSFLALLSLGLLMRKVVSIDIKA